ncbi:C-X-C motif chemokine 16-like [Ochotona curzoniae]|uniref:C-X-C motif chemokine 16-like n=1 Tax=Ochotona curzoniae TaxID=130825 RepID=UPI001B350F9E|nr:C-X-C motif chemokine 16-like [Ochotona curzoniae]
MAGGRVSLLLLLLLLLNERIRPGYTNEGSVAGSCSCDERISSGSPPSPGLMDHLQKHLRAYQSCTGYIRFQLRRRSVCGGKQDDWVQDLLRCFRLQECGHAHRKDLAQYQHFPPDNTQIQESPDEAPARVHTTAHTNPATTLQSTQIPGVPGNETTTVPGNHSVGAGPEAQEDQKHLEESLGPAARTTATVPVLSLLAITLLLAGVLTYVLCKRKRKKLLQGTPGVHYVSV